MPFGTSTRFCQSCGMPLTPTTLGSEADGSSNQIYCGECYKQGSFTHPTLSVQEMKRDVEGRLTHLGIPRIARWFFIRLIPKLGRWR